MSPAERSVEVRAVALFEAAIALPDTEREAFLVQATTGQPRLMERVSALLEQDDEGTKDYLISPVPAVDSARARRILSGSRPEDELVDRIVGFRLIDFLGAGSLGRAYLAEREADGERVVIKVVRPRTDVAKVTALIERERQTLERLVHPGICRLLGGGTTDLDMPYVVMEYVEGARTLREHADELGLDAMARVKLLLPICEALHHGHRHNVLHRELKPSNVLVGLDGAPRLVDYGLAFGHGLERHSTSLIEGGLSMDTLPYLSPEHVQNDTSRLVARSDVYSLGVLLYELLTGRLPYDVQRRTIADAARIIQEHPPTPITDVDGGLSAELDAVLTKTLEKNPRRRYASARALASDLGRFLRGEGVSARRRGLGYSARLLAQRHRGLSLVLASTVVVLMLGLAVAAKWTVGAVHARRRAETVSRFLTEHLEASDPRHWGKPASLPRLLQRMTAGATATFESQPEVRGHILATIGRTYAALGEVSQAEFRLKEACALLTDALGSDDPATLRARADLASVWVEKGRDAKAESALTDLLPRLRASLGPDDRATQSAMFSLGWSYFEQSRLQEARELLQECIADQERIQASAAFNPSGTGTGAFGIDLNEVRGALGSVLDELGLTQEARDLLKGVVDAERRALGQPRPDSLNNLGVHYWQNGELEEAEPLLRSASERFRITMGDSHPWTMIAILNLGSLYQELERPEEAWAQLEGGLERARVSLGLGHPTTLSFHNALGLVLQDQGRLEDADVYLTRAVDGARRLTRRTLVCASFLQDRADCRVELGREALAASDLLEVYALFKTDNGAAHASTLSTAAQLEQLYTGLGDTESATTWRARAQPASGDS